MMTFIILTLFIIILFAFYTLGVIVVGVRRRNKMIYKLIKNLNINSERNSSASSNLFLYGGEGEKILGIMYRSKSV